MSFDPSSLLTPGAVSLDVNMPNSDAAIRAAASLLSFHPAILDAEGFTQAVLAREWLHSNALPCGVAFPHARKSFVRDVVLSAMRLQPAVVFNGIMVRLIFVIGTPPDRTEDHLALLAWLAKKMSDATLRDQLLTARTTREFCDCLSGSPVQAGLASHE
jgi:mannitol/fructose-specific phosphotransferase system IIA component (Ntr-type)